MEFCTECHSGCCRAFNVEVIGIDVLRLHNALSLDPFMFLTALPIEGEKLEECINKTPLFKFTDLDPEKYYKIILQCEPTSMFKEYSSKCIFLMEWNPRKFGIDSDKIMGRCGIYNIRPFTCRTYPTKLDDDLNAVIMDPLKKIKGLADDHWKNPAYQLCPKQVEEKDYKRFSNQYFMDLHEQKYETDYFLKVSERWNENPDISDNLIKFLEKEYENRLSPAKS